MSAEPDHFRGEVALALAKDEQVILRCSFGAVSKMLPILVDAPAEVAARRHERLAINQRAFGREVPPLEEWHWNQHLLGAAAAFEVETVARCVAILAQERHPDMTAERVMDASPGWQHLTTALGQLIYLYHFKPGEDLPGEEATAPFGMIERLSALLSAWRPRTASGSGNSAG